MEHLREGATGRRAKGSLPPLLAKQGHTAEGVEKMYHTNPPTKLRNSVVIYFISKQIKIAVSITDWYQAWFKSLVLQVTLWSYPYAREGDF
jgi:hypothetical protein